MRAGSTSHERIIIIAGIALLVVALLVALGRHGQAPAAPPPPPQKARVVTVPVPMPVEQPVRVTPPAPVPPPVRVPRTTPVAITTPAPAPRPPEVPVPSGTPSASELAALYRDVGTTLQKLDRDKPRTADDLWKRYRWIRLADYLATPDKRAEAARLLTAIASDARRQ